MKIIELLVERHPTELYLCYEWYGLKNQCKRIRRYIDREDY